MSYMLIVLDIAQTCKKKIGDQIPAVIHSLNIASNLAKHY